MSCSVVSALEPVDADGDVGEADPAAEAQPIGADATMMMTAALAKLRVIMVAYLNSKGCTHLKCA